METNFSEDFGEEGTCHDAGSVTERGPAGEDGIPVKRRGEFDGLSDDEIKKICSRE